MGELDVGAARCVWGAVGWARTAIRVVWPPRPGPPVSALFRREDILGALGSPFPLICCVRPVNAPGFKCDSGWGTETHVHEEAGAEMFTGISLTTVKVRTQMPING